MLKKYQVLLPDWLEEHVKFLAIKYDLSFSEIIRGEICYTTLSAIMHRHPEYKPKLPPEKMSVWYPDRTPKLVEEFVRAGVQWLDEHPDKATAQRLLLLYAWNENGEGGYLTPTAADGTEYLKAVERAIHAER